MSVQQHDRGHGPLTPRPTRTVLEGVAALLVLVALVATLCGLITWAAVRMVQAFF
jgi:hypothetical protein